ncbi:MFS transporter [Streptomyces capillispiralis]|uniref:Putative MFS family arabinose efflux permease n=1 Tax=Streptomyces capillispiralis TaxID=68182 RepID=A0A561T8S7_9ACTN|nr:MFS transporter [Streptomyces capillispiralis]TWF83522.1 putative MFS family arabinose efflux permease [Streptomyces capillispiralis]GHH91688.1 MFS transporter [Streptomyces capillispiralis]
MVAGRTPGRFGWLWAAYGVSTFGTRFAFDAFALVAVLVLDAHPVEVSLLAAVGPAVGAVLSVPLGPWVEFRRKRPVMIATDLLRCAVLLSVPAAYALGALTVAQLLVVSVVVAAADITFHAAVGAYLKEIVPKEELLVANGRFEATTWTATMLGPPLGGAAIGWLGPMTTVVADAVSHLLSAGALGAAGGEDRRPVRPVPRVPPAPPGRGARLRAGDLLDGWRYILASPALRPLFLNTVLVSGLIMASSPLLVVLMVGPLGFAPWQYGLAFAVPCVGGLIGSRLSRRLVVRFGSQRVLRVAGTLRACWSLGLAFIGPGTAGLVLVMVIEFGLITCMGVFNPVFATRRLARTPADRVVRTLSAWSATSKAVVAALTALWGLLAALTGPRTAIGVAGVLLLATPLLLPRHDHDGGHPHEPEPAPLRAEEA